MYIYWWEYVSIFKQKAFLNFFVERNLMVLKTCFWKKYIQFTCFCQMKFIIIKDISYKNFSGARPVVYWYMLNNQLPVYKKERYWFIMFSNFNGMNTPVVAHFKLSVWHQLAGKFLKIKQLALVSLYKLASKHH